MSTEFYADYIKKTTFDPESSSVRQKFTAVKADDVEVEIEVQEEQIEEAATDTKKKPASKTPKLEVPATEIPVKEQSKKKLDKFHTKLDDLVHDTLGHSSDEKKMKEELHGDQHKLDHNKDKKITASDMKKVRQKGPVKEAHTCSHCGCDPMNPEQGCGCTHTHEEAMLEGTFKVDVEGLPTMYIDGSAGEIKAQLRKKFKDPKAVVSVERITPAEKKKELRAKVAEEQIDELDKKTMGSYIKKAAHDLDNRSFTQGMRDNNPKYTSADAKNNAKIRSRRAGIDRAVNKMSEDQAAIDAYLKKGGTIKKLPPAHARSSSDLESGVKGRVNTSRFKTKGKVKSMEGVEPVDEISNRTKAAYVRVAARDIGHQGAQAERGVANNDREAIRAADKKRANRLQGIDRATKGLQKESMMGHSDAEKLGASKDSSHSSAASHIDYHLRRHPQHASASGGERDKLRHQVAKKLGYVSEGGMKRIATQDAERERLGPKVKGSGLDTFKAKPPFDGGKLAQKGPHKDEYGNVVKNRAKHLARKAARSIANEDSNVQEGKKGLWDNIHAKRKRIEAGSGEKMRKPGSEGAPTAADFKRSQ